MRWLFGEWTAERLLPFGVSHLAPTGSVVRAGDIVARGTRYRTTRTVHAAGVLRCRPEQVRDHLRIGMGDEVRRGTVVARTPGPISRGIVAGEAGRLVHVGATGELYVASVRSPWVVRAPLDGTVVRADGHRIALKGEAWALEGFAGFGPDRAGILAVAVDKARDELLPLRLDATFLDRVVIAGARSSGEALARAHAVGASAVVAAAVSFAAVRPVYGDEASAFGLHVNEDLPTLLVLGAFGAAPFPEALFAALQALDGTRAAVDVRDARLYVFAERSASSEIRPPALFPDPDLSGARLR